MISLSVLLLAMLLFVLTFPPNGAKLFRKEGCIHCHKFKGEGGGVGPDLAGVAEDHSETWIKEQIRDPKLHNPDTRMPSFAYLSEREIEAIVKYLREEKD